MSDRLPGEIERLAVLEEAAPVQLAPAEPAVGLRAWIRRNLFSSPFNSALSVAVGALVVWLGWGLLHWVFVTADWGVFRANLASYMIGRFPREEAGRIFLALYFVVGLAGVSWGMTGKRLEWTAAKTAVRAGVAVVAVLLLAYLLDGLRIWLLLLAAVAVLAVGVGAGRAGGRSLRRPVFVLWLLAFPIVIVMLEAFDGVPPLLWGGFMLNVMAASVSIVISFPLGILLALGRRSQLPAVSSTSVGVIELIRGAPLFTWLLFGQFVLPLLLPPGAELPALFRAIVMLTLFSSVYVAEIVRGGLQGIPEGQYDAARALGLAYPRMMALVVMPQALRSTIPAMISHFISLFKDTSLLAIVAGFVDLLRAARRSAAGLEFIGDQKEALLPAAFLFWVVAFSMSRWSQRLERRLGVGER